MSRSLSTVFKTSRVDDDGEAEYHLISLYTRYSSWTVRAETLLEYFQIPYKCTTVGLSEREKLKDLSPSALVPVLIVDSPSIQVTVNDSLAICEFLAEAHPALQLWPLDPVLRARARSVVAEMHSGFSNLRNNFACNFTAKYTGNIPITEGDLKDIKRVLTIWDEARRLTKERLSAEEDDGYLFGRFGVADSFYWPVLWRFRSYSLPLDSASPLTIEWIRKMWNDPRLKEISKYYYWQATDPETDKASRVEHYEDIYAKAGIEGVEYGRFELDWEFTL